ncbi:MAG TPA: tetratricopeptide repeat protein [Rhodanobacter sp.]|nr:tetratricopeptide repeat protein [Rhodanobacter sp.]
MLQLRRRNVLRAAAFYAASTWLLVQVATQVFPFFHVAEWVVRWIVIAAVAGFPFAMLLSWFYEWTPQGLQRDSDMAPDAPVRHAAGRKLDRAIIVVLSLAVVALVVDRLVPHGDPDALPGKSIAVLPLVNESGNPKDDYFSDGLSEELIAALAQTRGLKVIGRSSSFRFRSNTTDSRMVGAKLGVATLLEGTVRRQDSRVRIVVDLVNAADGRQLWAQTYDRELDDIFTVQADIAQSVAAALKGALHRDPRPRHHVPRFETYDHFLLGLQLLVRNDVKGFPQAVEAFRQAIALDPEYADAYAYLAMAESFVADNDPRAPDAAAGRRRAMAAAQRAVALDPQLGAAYAARGYLRAADEWDWNGALADLRIAVQLDPNNARNQLRYGYVLSAMGRLHEAELAFEKGIEHDPLFPQLWYWLARTQAAQGDYAGARRALQRVLAINPEFTDATSYLGVLALLEGDASAAQAIFATVDSPYNQAMAEHDLGQPVRAQRTLDAYIAAHANDKPYPIAQAYAWFGDTDEAFAWLAEAIRQHTPGIGGINRDPLLRELRRDPRFGAVLRQIGLPANTSDPQNASAGESAGPHTDRKP